MSDENIYPSGQLTATNQIIKGRSLSVRLLGWITIIGLLSGYVLKFVSASEGVSQVIDRMVVSAGFFILLFGLVYREFTRIRKEKFANIQLNVHGAAHALRNVLTLIETDFGKDAAPSFRNQLIEDQIQAALNHLATAFNILTGTNCRVSIKMIAENPENQAATVFTYMRDSDSELVGKEDDEDRRDANLDTLSENTDFSQVMGEKGQRWFFCNDLSTRANYLNSKDPALKTRQLTPLQTVLNIVKPQNWSLPYISGIVWPIRQKKISKHVPNEHSLAGFLTVDSAHRGVFDQKFDVYLGAAVADQLYPVLLKINELTNKDWK